MVIKARKTRKILPNEKTHHELNREIQSISAGNVETFKRATQQFTAKVVNGTGLERCSNRMCQAIIHCDANFCVRCGKLSKKGQDDKDQKEIIEKMKAEISGATTKAFRDYSGEVLKIPLDNYTVANNFWALDEEYPSNGKKHDYDPLTKRCRSCQLEEMKVQRLGNTQCFGHLLGNKVVTYDTLSGDDPRFDHA